MDGRRGIVQEKRITSFKKSHQALARESHCYEGSEDSYKGLLLWTLKKWDSNQKQRTLAFKIKVVPHLQIQYILYYCQLSQLSTTSQTSCKEIFTKWLGNTYSYIATGGYHEATDQSASSQRQHAGEHTCFLCQIVMGRFLGLCPEAVFIWPCIIHPSIHPSPSAYPFSSSISKMSHKLTSSN